MSRWRHAFDRIGGPDAVTWPAFWVTYVLSLVGHLAVGGVALQSLGVRVVIVSVAQVALFVPLVVLRFTALRHPPHPRPWIAVAGFVLAAAIRGVVVAVLLVATGEATDPQWLYRFTASIGGITLPLLAMALVMSAMRAHTRSLEALLRVQDELVRTEARVFAEVTDRNEQALSRVRERLRAELLALESVQGAESVVELQRLATEVVRPMSHELAQSLPSRDVADIATLEARVSWRQAATQMIDRPPLQPFPAALFLVLVLVNVALGAFGPARGLPLAATMFAAVVVLSRGANKVLAAVFPRLRPEAAPIAVGLSCLAVGYLSTAASSIWLPETHNRIAFILLGGVFPSVVVLLSALVATILRQQRLTERALAESTERLRCQLVRLRQAQWLQQQALARALHGPVQAAVTSAALRLDAAVRAGEPHGDLLDDARSTLLSTIDVLDAVDADTPSLDVVLARITGTWEGVCAVTATVDECAASSLSSDSIASSVVMDIMTEAVSNAVRHGEARRADIAITAIHDDLVTLVMRDDGHGDSTPPMPGLGTALLDECTLEWSRDVTPAGCVLTVTLPTAVNRDPFG